MARSMVNLTVLVLLLCACYVELKSAAIGRLPIKPAGNNNYQVQQQQQQYEQQLQQGQQEQQLSIAHADNDRFYHPAEAAQPKLVEQFDQRSMDGHYEYRYVLSNGDARYERAYWLPVGKAKVLARKGYYSYPLPNHKYMTVFYTADHNGYHQDSASYSKIQPLLPRSLEVPEYTPPEALPISVITPALVLPTVRPVITTHRPTRPRVTSTTTRRPVSTAATHWTTTRRPVSIPSNHWLTTKPPASIPASHWPPMQYPW